MPMNSTDVMVINNNSIIGNTTGITGSNTKVNSPHNYTGYYYYNGYRDRTNTDRNDLDYGDCTECPSIKNKHRPVTNITRSNAGHHCHRTMLKDNVQKSTGNVRCIRPHSIANRRGAIKQQK